MINIFLIVLLCCTSEVNTRTRYHPINNHVNVEGGNVNTTANSFLILHNKINEIKIYIEYAVYRSNLYKFLKSEKKIIIHAISIIKNEENKSGSIFLDKNREYVLKQLFFCGISFKKLKEYNKFLNYMFIFFRIVFRLKNSYYLSFFIGYDRKNIVRDEMSKHLNQVYEICLRRNFFVSLNLINMRNRNLNSYELRKNIVKFQLELINFINIKLYEQFVYFNLYCNECIYEGLKHFNFNIIYFINSF
ncbi:hypothetical protein A0H76_450 [Hepatospora eriocheir]|uniref:Uncharacterized protein n=1 Tax=Hepatospora eriocheir TaxID=1081669 RepID=A0A1X0Q9X8_9MICR|nr:hypothetical protein A0H76_450 [Hepatospora eriocheir]